MNLQRTEPIDGHPPCYTRSMLVWWEAETGTPAAVEINGQRYRLTPLVGECVSTGAPMLVEPVVDAERGLILRALQEWANATAEDCERALQSLPEIEDCAFPSDLLLDLVVALGRFYHLRQQAAAAAGDTVNRSSRRVDSEVA
jgi:hypothetical protein